MTRYAGKVVVAARELEVCIANAGQHDAHQSKAAARPGRARLAHGCSAAVEDEGLHGKRSFGGSSRRDEAKVVAHLRCPWELTAFYF